MSARWVLRAFVAVLRRPGLWGIAVVQLLRLASPGWWRRWPPVPLPEPDYLRFRLQTQYGDADREPEPRDLLTYLHWCKGYGKVAR
jgi:hypothetical protein